MPSKPRESTKKPAAAPPRVAMPAAPPDMRLSVWLDQEHCEGHGRCVKACPSMFAIIKGKAVLLDGDRRLSGPESLTRVPHEHTDAVIKAADRCPSSAIFIEAP
jgi:ferredoxin